MGNFGLDENGVVVPFATEQVVRTLCVARRVLRDPNLDIPNRNRLRMRAEVEATRQIGRAVGADLAVAGTSLSGVVGRAVRAVPAAAFNLAVLRAAGVRVRDRLRAVRNRS